MNLSPLKTPEGWTTLEAAILAMLVQMHVLTPELSQIAQILAGGLIAATIALIHHKHLVHGVAPFQPIPKP